jgi:hypothetical protein
MEYEIFTEMQILANPVSFDRKDKISQLNKPQKLGGSLILTLMLVDKSSYELSSGSAIGKC